MLACLLLSLPLLRSMVLRCQNGSHGDYKIVSVRTDIILDDNIVVVINSKVTPPTSKKFS